MCKRQLLPWTIAASVLLHGVAFASLASERAPAGPAKRNSQLRFEVVSTSKAKQPELPASTTPDPPQPTRRAPEAKRQSAPPPPSPPDPAAEPAAAAAAGVTLAGDGNEAGFGMPLGDGGPLDPSRAPAPVSVQRPSPASPAPARALSAARLVSLGDLSTRPTPPALGSALERNYPADARRRGQSGTAKVRARIDPDGVVRQVSLVEESASGFGSACSRTLSGSRWAAPKDKAGRPVATEIRYTCRFVVEP